VSSGVAPATPVGAEGSVGIALEIDVDGRRDALPLSELLILSLVPRSAHGRPLVVHARAPGSHDEPLEVALSAIVDWQAETRLDASVRVDGRPIGSRR
jgi:hypothetical protein